MRELALTVIAALVAVGVYTGIQQIHAHVEWLEVTAYKSGMSAGQKKCEVACVEVLGELMRRCDAAPKRFGTYQPLTYWGE